MIRRDPRDLSRIYIILPEKQGYLEVPYRTLSNPAISLFEHRLALKRLKDKNKQQIDEASLFKAIDESRNIVMKAAKVIRSVRRKRTRIQENNKIQYKPTVQYEVKKETKSDDSAEEPFNNIEIWK